MKKILLITPPFTQLSSPYPAVPFLAGTLTEHNIYSVQLDLGLVLVLRLFSTTGLADLFERIEKSPQAGDSVVRVFLQKKNSYINTIEEVIAFLQGQNNGFAYKIINRSYLPEQERFTLLDSLQHDRSNISDYARIIASLYLDDLVDICNYSVLPGFNLCKYREQLVKSYDWNALYQTLEGDNLISEYIAAYLTDFDFNNIDIAGITIPFPGSLSGALWIGRWIKKNKPAVKVVLGGGYVNTELTFLKEKGIFEFADYITLNNGELPLLRIIEHIRQSTPKECLIRTFVLEQTEIVYYGNRSDDILPTDLGVPAYTGLPLKSYFSVIETTNPMHRLWSEKIYLKLRLALGCYYHSCRFCDTSLDYIGCYKPLPLELIVKQIEQIIAATGITDFHFVDEALPPALIKKLALKLLEKGLRIAYWGNIRFDKFFDYDLCRLLKQSGLIAVTGGLESASNKMLKITNKGFTIEEALEVCYNLSSAGILVHCYLIYGLPAEEPQDCYTSLEIIRQMFKYKIIHSAFYHRFALTIHSEFYQNYHSYQLQPISKQLNNFANNDIEYQDAYYATFTQLTPGIEKAVYNFNYRNCLNKTVGFWFKDKSAVSLVDKNFVRQIIQANRTKRHAFYPAKQLIFIGDLPLCYPLEGETIILFSNNKKTFEYAVPEVLAQWLILICTQASYTRKKRISLADIEPLFPENIGDTFENFLHNELFNALRSAGLLFV